MKSLIRLFFSFFIFNNKFIEFFLPFSTAMRSKKKKKSVIYLLYLISLKISVTALAWYLVAVPLLDAQNHGYYSFYFQLVGILIGMIAIPAFCFIYGSFMGKKFMNKDRSVSVTSLFMNNRIKIILKIIYWHFFAATLILLFIADTSELDLEVLQVLEKHSLLNFFTLFASGILYAFTNKYFEIKIHQYFYYFFDLRLNLDEYEKRIKELSKDYSILYTRFNSYMFRSDRNLARDSRVIILRNKYIPISFTLTYYAVNFETSYDVVYPNEYAAGVRPSYQKNMRESKIHPRTLIMQKCYPEKIKKRLREGRRKTSIPIGKLLIIGRVISVLLVIILVLAINNVFTIEALLEQGKSSYSGVLLPLIVLLITYWFAWFYTNIAVSVGMYFLIKEIDYKEEPITFLILIAVTIIVNVMVISFWKEKKIKDLFYLK